MGATGPTGSIGPRMVGVTGVVGPAGVACGPGPTGFQGSTGATGPIGPTGPFRLPRPVDFHLAWKVSGSPGRILGQARRSMAGLGHRWHRQGRIMSCDACMCTVLVDPTGRRGPRPRDHVQLRRDMPSCAAMRRNLVDSVHDR